MRLRIISVLPLIVLFSATAVSGEHGNAHHAIQHDAHVHGESTLQLVLQGNELEMEFHSPAMNIVGFEHKPTSKEEKSKLKDAMAMLKDADTLFSFKGTQCRLINAATGLEKDHHGHGADEHGDSKHTETHSDIDVNYAFGCENGSQLQAIEIKLFDQFSGIHKLEAEWILNGKQGAAGLVKGAQVISIN